MASLARIAWRIGQVLLPEDFEALEEALSEEARARAETPGLPSYGWLALEWDPGELMRGVVRIEKARAALPGGRVIQAGDNVSLPEPLNLKRAGTQEVDVHFQVLAAEAPSEEHRSRTGPAERLVQKSRLSFEEAAPRGRSLLVGRFETRDGRAWQLSPALVPPLLRIRTTPHLYARLVSLRAQLVRHDEELAKHAAAARRSVGPAQAFQRGRAEIRKAVAVLDDALLEQDSPAWARQHPYAVLASLRDLLVELCLVEDELPQGSLPQYDHDDLGAVFGGVMRAIETRIDRLPPATPTIPFQEDEGRFVASSVPEDVLDAPELYLVIERPTPYAEVPLERYNIRLGEPGRLPWLSQHSTRGIRPVRTSSSPVDFGPRFDVYALPKQGKTPEEKEEWAHVKKTRSIGFLRPKELGQLRAALYWTYGAEAAR